MQSVEIRLQRIEDTVVTKADMEGCDWRPRSTWKGRDWRPRENAMGNGLFSISHHILISAFVSSRKISTSALFSSRILSISALHWEQSYANSAARTPLWCCVFNQIERAIFCGSFRHPETARGLDDPWTWQHTKKAPH
eukprot:gene26475-35134_t